MPGTVKRKPGGKENDPEAQQLLGDGQTAAPCAVVLHRLGAALVSIAWMVVSSGLILLNKQLLVTDGFKYPMTLSGMGMLFSAVASFLACRVFNFVTLKSTEEMTLRYYAVYIMPVGFFMAATFHFGNLVYLYLTVSFIQMLKAFTPIMTMVLLFAARLETPTRKMVYSVLVVAFGTALASYGEVQMSFIGMVAMFLSSGAEALRLVLTQYVLVGRKFHPIEGLMYLAPSCVFWLLVGIYFFEVGPMIKANALQLITNSPMKYLLASGLGFGVNSLAYGVIVLSSSLTLKLLATVKSAALVLFLCYVPWGNCDIYRGCRIWIEHCRVPVVQSNKNGGRKWRKQVIGLVVIEFSNLWVQLITKKGVVRLQLLRCS